jgi:glycosyltransferase involved in cell wall biosynthesis
MSPRGMLVPELLRRRRRVAKALWLRFLERPNLRHASAIHFTSELERDQAQAAGVDCLRAAIIPNGVELPGDGQAPLPGEIAAFAAGGPFVLSLGRIHWKKGLDHLVRAAAQAPALRIAVVGNDEGERSALESLARELGVADRVLFAGPVYADAKWSLLRRAAAVALPSQSENFANVVLEAMAAARPVVVSPAVGLATVVRDARCGMVVEPRPDSLAEALQALLSDPERAAAMGARGRATAESEYPWIHIARRTEALYASLERPRWT